MPVNRNALLRYRTIDNCLRNKYRTWTLEDLMDACSEALYEYEGIDKGISRRTIQMDLQIMRSDKLGYNAPIIVTDKKYYSYENPDYSITNNPLSQQDLNKLTEAVGILKQFRGFSHFQELGGMVQRLEDKIHTAKTNNESVIDFEKNDNLKGLEFIDTLYKSVIDKKCIEITYQSFRARTTNTFIFHPYLLKEYRNRWFVLGVSKKNNIMLNLALDRIVAINKSEAPYKECDDLNLKSYFKDVIGVTVNSNAAPEKIILFFDSPTAPYVLTKPLHHSQKLVESLPFGTIISLEVQINFELEKEILGFGDSARVISPEKLKRRIKDKLGHAIDLYNTVLDDKEVTNNVQKVNHKGTAILQNVFTKKETNKIKGIIQEFINRNKEKLNIRGSALRQLLLYIPELKPLVINPNLKKVLAEFHEKFFLTKAIYFDKTPESNWYVTWHQDRTINVKERKELPDFSGWTKKGEINSVCPPEEVLKSILTFRIHLDEANENNGGLMVIPGSHHKKLNDSEIALITQSSLPLNCKVSAGGLHIMKPLVLHASSKSLNQKPRRVIHLEFSAVELPNGLEWYEKCFILKF